MSEGGTKNADRLTDRLSRGPAGTPSSVRAMQEQTVKGARRTRQAREGGREDREFCRTASEES